MQERSPWISIWTSPKQTIRRVVLENPKKGLLWLSAFYGFSWLLGTFQAYGLPADVDVFALTLLAIILAPFWGYVVFSFWSCVVLFTGKLFKGVGDFQSVRAAFAWANVPLAINMGIWIVLIFVYGQTLFLVPAPSYDATFSIILLCLLLVKVTMSVWSFVLYLNTLAEVQNYSILRSIGNILVAAIVAVFILSILLSLFMYLLGVNIDQASSVQAAFELFQQSKLMLNQSVF